MSSSLKEEHAQKSPLSESSQLNDSFSKELQPIVYTPEDCRKSLQNPSPALVRPLSHTTSIANDSSLKMPCEVDSPLNGRTECKQNADSSLTICDDIRSLKNKLPEPESLPNSKSSLPRYKNRILYNSFFPKPLKLLMSFLFFVYIGGLFHRSSILPLV